jgi:capsular polysaccharide biosynthesis protein
MEQEITLDLREIYEIIKRKMWLIVGITLTMVVVSGVLSIFIIPPTYEAKTTIIIGKEQSSTGDKQSSSINYSDVMMYQQLVKTYVEIAKSRTVAEKAAAKIENGITPEMLMSSTSVTPQANTQILVIKIQDKTAQDAMNKVNILSQTFIEETQRIYPSGNVQIMDKATLPASPIKPRPKLNIAIAFILGLMVSLGIIFVVEYMDSTIKTEQDVEKYLELPVIGIIPKQLEE